MVRFKIVIVFAIFICLASATQPNTNSQTKNNEDGVQVSFGRNINAKVCGKIIFGPCGRPKSNVNVDIKSGGETNVKGNAFQAVETAGRLSEIMKLVGNRFKPEVECPPRPPSNTDTSAESICAQRTVRRKPGPPSGRKACRHKGKDGVSARARPTSFHSSIGFNSGSSLKPSFDSGHDTSSDSYSDSSFYVNSRSDSSSDDSLSNLSFSDSYQGNNGGAYSRSKRQGQKGHGKSYRHVNKNNKYVPCNHKHRVVRKQNVHKHKSCGCHRH